jgi:RimJ/RimL family protein N-acetyltransferase
MIATERLTLRRWQESDRAPFHAMCNDPDVMAQLGPLQSRAETDAAIDRQNGFHDTLGYCFWAIERREDGAFLGFCGLKPGAADTPIAGEIEIGWRLARPHWGSGYAREAAQASLAWGWANLAVDHVAAITTLANLRSRGLMERLGMVRALAQDFDHPHAPDWLSAHITYRIARR